MELRAVSTSVGTTDQGDKVIDVTLEGTYYHSHSYYKSAGQQFTWNVNCHVEDYTYPVTGRARYFLDRGDIEFGLSGRLSGQPRYDHASTFGISGRGNEFGVLQDSVDRTIVLRRPARLPESGQYGFFVDYRGTARGTVGYSPEGCRPSDDSTLNINYQDIPIFFRSLTHEAKPLQARGIIAGEVKSKTGGISVDRGTVQLFDQSNPETPLRQTTIKDDGTFEFVSVPVFTEERHGGSTGLRRPLYQVKLAHAETDVDPRIFGQPVVYFAQITVDNVRVPDSVLLQPVALPEIGTKIALANALSQLGKTNYAPVEQPVLAWLDELAKGDLDDVALEKLRRGIWAERIVREGANAGDATLELTLKAIGNILAELYGDMLDVESQQVASSRQFQKKRRAFQEGTLSPARAPRLLGVDPKLRGSYNMALQRLSRRADLADAADVVSKTIRLAQFGIFDGLKAAGMEAKQASDVSWWFAFALRSLAGYISSGTFTGAATNAIKTLIPKIVAATRPIIFDNRLDIDLGPIGQADLSRYVEVFPSYTKATKPLLQIAVDKMMGWDQANFETYVTDSTATAAILNTMIEEHTNMTVRNAYLMALTNTADLSTDALELAGKSGIKAFTAAAEIAKWAKYLLNSAAIIDPAVYLFHRNPELMLQGVLMAYGDSPVEETGAPLTGGKVLVYPGLGSFNAQLADEMPAAQEALQGTIEQLVEALLANQIGEAMELTSGETPGTYVDALEEWDRSVSIVLEQAYSASLDAFDGNLAAALPNAQLQHAEVRGLKMELAERLNIFYQKAFFGEFEGPTDPLYLAERNRVVAVSHSFSEMVGNLGAAMDSLVRSLSGLTFLPAVAVDMAPPRSTQTGGVTITQGDEEFTVRAHLRNISTVPVAGLVARLTIVSPRGTVTAVGDLIVPIGAGDLAPADGVRGSGPDEADVEWAVRYRGDLTSESVRLIVAVLQQDQAPIGLTTFSDMETLQVDVSVAQFVDVPAPQEPRQSLTDGEPRVAVDRNEVVLTPNNPIAAVLVSNVGDGTLYWTAIPDNDSLVVTSPAFPEAQSTTLLFISVPPGFVFEADRAAETVVRIVDAFGADTDVFEIIVIVDPTGS